MRSIGITSSLREKQGRQASSRLASQVRSLLTIVASQDVRTLSMNRTYRLVIDQHVTVTDVSISYDGTSSTSIKLGYLSVR